MKYRNIEGVFGLQAQHHEFSEEGTSSLFIGSVVSGYPARDAHGLRQPLREFLLVHCDRAVEWCASKGRRLLAVLDSSY
jgi:hypothetical protein